ncbi:MULTISPECIES: helix-turn-helix domain-containing protein [Actinotignum]|uniref:helix-turn-helix domain-containing protein n=1 Tax=Actinotignum TaxID=1653174 RepID=UPI00255093E2|nr:MULTISPECIES: helix-turn-helix domain-containing protein [Actinotignum]MDE1537293.1 helix-turn-helix domain-containing protein [Actinotignum schaalii]MDK7272509.1 helix-turn-helix domain-containing protein [Actinotignum schaalii]MDY5144645.1 helix-turn-helix domain-containing protein [Actinotignum timonense]
MDKDTFAASRRHLRLSVKQCAAALGVSPRTLRAWESGRDPIPPGAADDLAALMQRPAPPHANSGNSSPRKQENYQESVKPE